MIQMNRFVDSKGRLVVLDQQLAAGGEGTVYALVNNPDQVAKIYHIPSKLQADKLTAMVRLFTPQLSRVSAWPQDLLFHAQTRQVVGFIMPRLHSFRPIQNLYNPAQRSQFFPEAA